MKKYFVMMCGLKCYIANNTKDVLTHDTRKNLCSEFLQLTYKNSQFYVLLSSLSISFYYQVEYPTRDVDCFLDVFPLQELCEVSILHDSSKSCSLINSNSYLNGTPGFAIKLNWECDGVFPQVLRACL